MLDSPMKNWRRAIGGGTESFHEKLKEDKGIQNLPLENPLEILLEKSTPQNKEREKMGEREVVYNPSLLYVNNLG